MPFKRLNVKEEIEKESKSDPKFANAYKVTKTCMNLVMYLMRVKKKMDINDDELAEKAGISIERLQTMYSFEHVSITKLILVADALGYELVLKEKENIDESNI